MFDANSHSHSGSHYRNLDGLYSHNNNNLFRMMPTARSSKKTEESFTASDKFPVSDKFDDSIIGMPIRTINYRHSNQKSNKSDNSDKVLNHVDFNLFDSTASLNVTSYDLGGIGHEYSDVSNFGSPLLNPLKQSPEYFMTLLINCLSFDLVTVLNTIIKNKFYCIPPLSVISSLNFVYGLYSTGLYSQNSNSLDVNTKELMRFFQNKPAEYINNSLARLSSDIKNLSNLSNLTIVLVNHPSYQNHETEFNKYSLGNSMSFCVTSNNPLLLHKINNLIKIKTNKQITTNININSNILNESFNTGNNLIIYNFSILTPTFKEPFLKKNTKKGLFHEENGNKKLVNFMKLSNINSNYYCDQNISLLELECLNGMNLGILTSINNISSFKYENVENYIKNLKMTSFEYIVIPKIKYQTKIKLNETLKKMGLNNLFHNTNKINNMGIYSLEHYVTVLFDDVFEMPNASAQMINTAPLIDDRKIKFRANRPFLFYIRTVNNNCINLVGRFC